LFQVARHDDKRAIASVLQRGKFHFGIQLSA
jgi:hypothetical protein